ncbi:MAG: hypothetical protein U1E89_03690 [Burkholderiaceae bacterium]
MKDKPSWGRFAGPFKEFGAAVGLLYVAHRLLSALSPRFALHYFEIMAQPITGKPLLASGLARNLSFRELHSGDPEITLMPAREDIKADRFRSGARCLAAYRKHQLLGYMWLAFERYREDEARFTFELAAPKESAFDFDFYVFPEHRMGIGFMAIWHGGNAFLHERGVRWSFSRVTRFNTASRRAHLRLGGQVVGSVWVLQLGVLEVTFATVAPFVALTWRRTQRVTLNLVLPNAPIQNLPKSV